MTAPRAIHPLTVEQVLRMVEVGILPDGEPCELLEGALVPMAPKGPLHSILAMSLSDRLGSIFGAEHVWVEQPVRAGLISLPEPDVAVTTETRRTYRTRHPDASETVLVIEVAISSITEDQSKAAIYASSGAPCYWILDVPGRRLWEHRGPQADGTWRQTRVLGEDEEVEVPGTTLRWRVGGLIDEG